MEKLKNIKTFITNHPDEVIGYYGHGSNSYLFFSIPLTFFALMMYDMNSYGGIPLVAMALFAWYKVFTKTIYFVINPNGIAFQSALGFYRWFYSWSEIAAFHFTVKIVYGRHGGSGVKNKIVFQKKEAGGNLTLLLDGMEERFDEIHHIVERLTAKQNITNGGIVQL
jgi:hypothetical protein